MREMIQLIRKAEHLVRLVARELKFQRIFVLRIVFIVAGAVLIDDDFFPCREASGKRFRERQARRSVRPVRSGCKDDRSGKEQQDVLKPEPPAPGKARASRGRWR